MQRFRASFLTFGLAALMFLLAAGNAFAWEWAYGPPNSFEQAFRRVAPVLNCPSEGLGYIAVGTFDQLGANPEVYVVYTNLTGAPVWERTYDVQASTYEDEGMAIVEVPGGFVILSNSRKPGTPWMPALTYIKCDGKVQWTVVYPDVIANQDLRGHDLIQLATGNPAFGTAAGDFAVAGSWFNGVNEDAFLMRTTAAGALIWNIAYNPGGVEAFNALTEAGPATLQPTADIVAVGRFSKVNGDLQGLVARVNGDTGGIGGALQCLAHHGLNVPNSHEVYNSVTTLTSPNFFGQFALIGTSTNPFAYSDDVWMTRGNPCAIAAQSRIGNPLGTAPTSEHGNDLREIQGPVIGPVGGVLAIAGDHAPPGLAYDATYLQVATATLLPNGASGRIFGDHASSNEVFFSLAEDPATWSQGGWVLAGYTETDWQGIGDPRDLYLVHYNPLSTVSGCEKKWSPDGVQLTWPSNPLTFQRRAPARYRQVHTLETPQWNPWLVCPW